jgi:hypothetical protein
MSRRAGALVLGFLLVTSLAPARADAPVPIAPYLRARDEGRTGTITGEAFAEPTRPGGPPAPYADVSVRLLPSAPDFEAELDRVRAELRESARAYLAALERLRGARERLERELIFSGGGELVRREVSDAGGRFRFANVPAGAWTLIAWRDVPHAVSPRLVPGRDVGAFVGNSEMMGRASVEHWRVAVEVRPGESAVVRLHDRNVWLTAVREDKRTPKAPGPGEGGGSKRRQDTTP